MMGQAGRPILWKRANGPSRIRARYGFRRPSLCSNRISKHRAVACAPQIRSHILRAAAASKGCLKPSQSGVLSGNLFLANYPKFYLIGKENFQRSCVIVSRKLSGLEEATRIRRYAYAMLYSRGI
ncbi:hypothetical protein BHE74_00042326 [Ensete ventricosum]|nr:hypothetical protein BHE74_00042326 [Ensete ventricosum]